MKYIKTHIFYLVCILILVILLLRGCYCNKSVTVIPDHKEDNKSIQDSVKKLQDLHKADSITVDSLNDIKQILIESNNQLADERNDLSVRLDSAEAKAQRLIPLVLSNHVDEGCADLANEYAAYIINSKKERSNSDLQLQHWKDINTNNEKQLSILKNENRSLLDNSQTCAKKYSDIYNDYKKIIPHNVVLFELTGGYLQGVNQPVAGIGLIFQNKKQQQFGLSASAVMNGDKLYQAQVSFPIRLHKK